jgi:hypothetical protein
MKASLKKLAAAKRNGQILRQRAIDGYLKNPSICKQCGQVIPLVPAGKNESVVSIARHKIFCGHSCSAKFNNLFEQSPKRIKTRIDKICTGCEKVVDYRTVGTLCLSCKVAASRLKLENSTRSQVVRTVLSEHARSVLFADGIKPCLVCGYDFVVEAAHIKAVKDFPAEATIKEINALENLLPLCPNHHLELDRGKLKLEQL